jgi:hypothetical protein
MLLKVLVVALVLPVVAAAVPAAADEAVIRGGAINFPTSETAASAYFGSSARVAGFGTTILRGVRDIDRGSVAYSGSSMPPAAGSGTTVLRGGRAAEIVRQTPASNLGGDTDGPVLNPACLYTEPPTCR